MNLIDSLRERLPERYIELIMDNMDNPKDINSSHFMPIESELMSLFPWELSNEGYEFWNSVHLFLINITGELPFIPIEIEYAPDTIMYSETQVHIMNLAGQGLCIKFNNDSDNPMSNITPQLREKILGILN